MVIGHMEGVKEGTKPSENCGKGKELLENSTEGRTLHIDLWLMSCRVLKRDMEYAMLDELIQTCRAKQAGVIYGYYYPTAKNGMVKDFYARMGFEKIQECENGTTWRFTIPDLYEKKNRYITVKNSDGG